MLILSSLLTTPISYWELLHWEKNANTQNRVDSRPLLGFNAMLLDPIM